MIPVSCEIAMESGKGTDDMMEPSWHVVVHHDTSSNIHTFLPPTCGDAV